MDKLELRNVYLEKRRLITEEEYARRNTLITKKLIAFYQLHQPKHVHCFLPIEKNREPDTWPFIKFLWDLQPKVTVSTSVSELTEPVMHHFEIDGQTTFKLNRWNIPEPEKVREASVLSINMVLVPMVIGSKSGHRIGYGKGYYDRFLSKCDPSIMKVGVNIGPLLEGHIFADEFDIPLDVMITPFQIFD